MKFRKLMARVFGFQAAPQPRTRTPPADPLRVAYDNALILLDAIYSGSSWSRRAMAERMSQPQWTAATQLLRMAGILDRQGRRARLDYDAFTAEALLREVVRSEREKRKNPKYVSPI